MWCCWKYSEFSSCSVGSNCLTFHSSLLLTCENYSPSSKCCSIRFSLVSCFLFCFDCSSTLLEVLHFALNSLNFH